MRSRLHLQLILSAAVAIGLAGCDSVRSAAGIGKDSPDEFAIVTKAPLVIPPDYNLRPPTAGAAPTNQLEPTQAAQAALFNPDPAAAAAAMPATTSAGERYLLANAGVQNADPAIRQEIASDADETRAADDSFTNALLFGSSTPTGNVPVNADAEARRVDAAKAGDTTVAPAPAPAPPPPSERKGGWLSDLFDW